MTIDLLLACSNFTLYASSFCFTVFYVMKGISSDGFDAVKVGHLGACDLMYMHVQIQVE